MTPNGVDFSFLFFLVCLGAVDRHLHDYIVHAPKRSRACQGSLEGSHCYTVCACTFTAAHSIFDTDGKQSHTNAGQFLLNVAGNTAEGSLWAACQYLTCMSAAVCTTPCSLTDCMRCSAERLPKDMVAVQLNACFTMDLYSLSAAYVNCLVHATTSIEVQVNDSLERTTS